jgi:GxxExxY protein
MNTDGFDNMANIEDKLIHRQITEKIIGAAMEVHNTLGAGFFEKVYENALVRELSTRGLKIEQQKSITVHYKGEIVGEYIADLVVADAVVVELKTVDQLTDVHQAQLLNYLKATNMKVGLILNFNNPHLEFKRMVG